MLSQLTINRIQETDIISIAQRLGLNVRNRKCRCPFHEDRGPSLAFWPSVNGWKCYGCGEKGSSIDLVMKVRNLGFVEACQWLMDEFGIIDIPEGVCMPKAEARSLPAPQSSPDVLPSVLVERAIQGAEDTAFCRALVNTGLLSQKQVEQVIMRYRLGRSHDGGIVFWQIDEQERVRDGKIMYYLDNCHRDHLRKPTWVSYRLRKRGMILNTFHASPCFFGQHLLRNTLDPLVAIVESEKTAVVCSQLVPSYNGRTVVWLASGGLSQLRPELFLPLKDYDIIVFPDTDTQGEAYRKWSEVVAEAQHLLSHPIFLSDLLERCASAEQKQLKIDLLDLLTGAPGIP